LIGFAAGYFHDGDLDNGIKILSVATHIFKPTPGDMQLDYADQIEYDRLYAAAQQHQAEWDAAWTAGQSTLLAHRARNP